MPLPNDPTEAYWRVEELLARIYEHDFSEQEWEIVTIAWQLAGDGRVLAIGRPCDDADQPRDQWEVIPAHAVTDLVLPVRPRARPHPGDVFWRPTGKRAYAFVRFREADLMREWLAEMFARPRHAAPADVIIPPVKSTDDLRGVALHQPMSKPNPTLGDALTDYRQGRADQDLSLRGFNRYIRDNHLSGKPGFGHKQRKLLWENKGLPLDNPGGRGHKG